VEIWTNLTRSNSFEGATGLIRFTETGDRYPLISVSNFLPERLTWQSIGVWDPLTGLVLNGNDVIWHSNTTEIPDLDIRPPFDYWSCSERKMKTDSTGKTIKIESPGSGDVDYIDSTYRCDNFIDCRNLSDEEGDCASNYLVLFIVMGILTGICILFAFVFFCFVIVFGFIFPRRRFRAASPSFLIIIIMSCVVGYASVFAWYGKPHPVACGFQPWLLGLSVVSMVSALCAKTFRIWRIFKQPMNHLIISDLQLLVLWLIMILPALLILTIWTIVSTPTAKLEERSGEDHYVCTTGGFTGTPGGLVFFFILVGYGGAVLLFAGFLSFVTRNVPSFFNESSLLLISIYNLVFLSVVVIPVFLVLQTINPFAAWIIRTVAILYAFSATLWLQFLPKIIGVILIDRCKDSKLLVLPGVVHNSSSRTSPTNESAAPSSDTQSPR